jgi:phosphomannomutase
MDTTILLFDVDGTLTASRQEITPEMKEYMLRLTQRVAVGLVGGSDFAKIKEQVGAELIHQAAFIFAENGCVALKAGQVFFEESISSEVGEDVIKRLINFSLRYIADIDIPIKRGTFIEYRKGMINLSPIGRNCSQAERNTFVVWDNEQKIRERFVAALREEFRDTSLQFSIGGQISIDVFPRGWDKTHCLRFLEEFRVVHFFGDKTEPGGNDYELYASERTIGHKVTSPEDTRRQVDEVLRGLGLEN